jgi:RNA polymerase sigma-70 factor (ECF subfamily)
MKATMDDTSFERHDECAALFAAALKGDNLAAARLYSLCIPPLRVWLSRRFNESTVEDLAHDALVTAFRKAARFQPGTSFQSWLKTIASHLALNFQRDEVRRRSRESAYVQLIGVNADTKASADQARATRLSNSLLTLPEPQRHLIHLRFFEGKSAETIAEAQGRNRGAVAVSLHRICRRLRDGMQTSSQTEAA